MSMIASLLPAQRQATLWVKTGILAITLFVGSSLAQARDLPDFTALVEKQGPAVVNISTTQKVKTRMHQFRQLPEGPLGDLFRYYFGEPDGEGDEGDTEEYDAKSLGSGFIISKDGYVMTNAHVIKDASEILVRLSDRRELVAEVVGSDSRSDIALLKIKADNLPVVSVGKVDDLKVGEWVLAIGSPFGFDHSVTAGIVSAKGRSLPRENYVPFIQTDVAINPGNSGGPLFDLDGNVVGVNSQIYSRTGGFMGLSFAIPIDTAMQVVRQLKDSGHVTRAWLGVQIQDVTRELAESFGMETPRGALVARVLPDSPALKGGLKVGDVITRFNGSNIVHSSDLPPLVGASPVGDKANVEILRDGKSKLIKLELAELPEEEPETEASGSQPKPATEGRLKIQVQDLTAEQREALQIEAGGVVVTEVAEGPARDAGLRRGDVIVMLDNTEVRNAKHFKELVDGLAANKAVPLLIQRRGDPVFLALKIKNGK
jgi:serine protease Do